jgi:hypothetical protein
MVFDPAQSSSIVVLSTQGVNHKHHLVPEHDQLAAPLTPVYNTADEATPNDQTAQI